MFASRFLLFALSFFLALAHARPTAMHHQAIVRRANCPKKSTIWINPSPTTTPPVVGAPSSSPVPASSTSAPAIPPSDPPAPSFPAEPSSTPRPASSSTPSQSASTSASASSSSSAETPAPTGVIPGLLGNLFPVQGYGQRAWSTSNVLGSAVALSDETFRPQRVLRSVPHTYRSAPDGKAAMRAFYPAGSHSFGHQPQGGFSFYAPGPAAVDLKSAKEATFSYSVFFPQGFNFVLGGKLPGLYGGNSEDEAVGCSGGRRSSACFSARIMWRTGGDGEFYTYLPTQEANNKVCNLPGSYCHPVYGASIGRGAFKFATGAWTTVSERVRLNDVGQANGALQLFVNGQSVLNVEGLVLRDSGAGKIRGMQMQTFFGGSKDEFATPRDQEVFFSDFSVAVTQTL